MVGGVGVGKLILSGDVGWGDVLSLYTGVGIVP